MSTTQYNATAVGLFKYRDTQFVIFDHNNKKYICLRGLVESIGLQWKSARQTAFSGDNADLYGTEVIFPAPIAGSATTGGTNKLYVIRLDCVQIYLTRVNTSIVRLKNNGSIADQVLALQQEWAKVLHLYESGETVSKTELNDERSLIALINAQKNCNSEQRDALSRMISRRLESMGTPERRVQKELGL